uniref:Peptidoglycan recognition protein family domain-containing protein n=2 Tax=Capitella teleta TaxID=283909 RepID=X1ZWR0_CAPTE
MWTIATLTACLIASVAADCTITSRAAWGARPPTSTSDIGTRLRYIVHHSAGAACTTSADCMAQVRSIQNFHMDSNDHFPIFHIAQSTLRRAPQPTEMEFCPPEVHAPTECQHTPNCYYAPHRFRDEVAKNSAALSLFHVNAQGVSNKKEQLKEDIQCLQLEFTVIGISETHLRGDEIFEIP